MIDKKFIENHCWLYGEHFDSPIEAEKHRFGSHYDYLLAQVSGQKEVLRDYMVNFESRWKKYLNS